MTRPGNPANYQCKGKMGKGLSRGYTVHHWQFSEDGIARCLNKGCGVVLSAEDSQDLHHTNQRSRRDFDRL